MVSHTAAASLGLAAYPVNPGSEGFSLTFPFTFERSGMALYALTDVTLATQASQPSGATIATSTGSELNLEASFVSNLAWYANFSVELATTISSLVGLTKGMYLDSDLPLWVDISSLATKGFVVNSQLLATVAQDSAVRLAAAANVDLVVAGIVSIEISDLLASNFFLFYM